MRKRHLKTRNRRSAVRMVKPSRTVATVSEREDANSDTAEIIFGRAPLSPTGCRERESVRREATIETRKY